MGNRILVIDDHPLVREALIESITTNDPDCLVSGAATLAEGLNLLSESHFEVVLLDLALPDCDGPMSLARLRAAFPEQKVAVVSATIASETILHCMGLGAAGYIPKNSSRTVILDALRLIMRGGRYIPPEALTDGPAADVAWNGALPLRASAGIASYRTAALDLGMTERQTQVLRLVLAGMPNKSICRQLHLAEGTVKVHVSAVLRVLGVRSRTQAVIAAGKLGLLAGERLDPRTGEPAGERLKVKSGDTNVHYFSNTR